MKLLFCKLCVTVITMAGIQVTSAQIIPNNSFENWISGTYESPVGFTVTSNPVAFFRCEVPFNVEKVTDAYHGNYAIRLTTRPSNFGMCLAYFLNSNTNYTPGGFMGGIPISESPTGFTGYYKSSIPAGDSAVVLLIFKKQGVVLASYYIKLYGEHSTYTPFSLTFQDLPPIVPDTVVFGAASSDVFQGTALPYSMLQLDAMRFTGVTTQPSQFQGSVELWQPVTLYKPAGGWINNLGETGEGLYRSANAFTGMYGLELKTRIEINIRGEAFALPTVIGSGGTVCNDEYCGYVGGSLYNLRKDTFLFRYKYIPRIEYDHAYLSLLFIKNGNYLASAGMMLSGTSTYRLASLPFELSDTPDRVIVTFESGNSYYADPSFAGASFTIDDLQFASENTGTGLADNQQNRSVKLFPNPTNGKLFLQSDVPVTHVEIYSVNGQRVLLQTITGNRTELQLQQQPKGVYFYKVFNKGMAVAKGKIILQ